jgi:hypothetical protein
MALDHLSLRAIPNGSAAARFTAPELLGFAAYAIAVGAGRPAFDFFLSALRGEDAPPLDDAPFISPETDGMTQFETWRPPVAAGSSAVEVKVS